MVYGLLDHPPSDSLIRSLGCGFPVTGGSCRLIIYRTICTRDSHLCGVISLTSGGLCCCPAWCSVPCSNAVKGVGVSCQTSPSPLYSPSHFILIRSLMCTPFTCETCKNGSTWLGLCVSVSKPTKILNRCLGKSKDSLMSKTHEKASCCQNAMQACD